MIKATHGAGLKARAQQLARQSPVRTEMTVVDTVIDTGLPDGLVMAREGGQFCRIEGADLVLLSADGVELKRRTPTPEQWDGVILGYALEVARQPTYDDAMSRATAWTPSSRTRGRHLPHRWDLD